MKPILIFVIKISSFCLQKKERKNMKKERKKAKRKKRWVEREKMDSRG